MPDQYEELENLIQDGKLEAAEQRLFQWIRDHPNDSHAWMLYGKSVASQTQKRDCFRRALSLDPSNSEAEVLLKQLDSAISPAFQKASQSIGSKLRPPISIPSPQQPTFQTHPIVPKSPIFNEVTITRFKFLIYSFLHFLFTILLGATLVFILASLVPGLLHIKNSTETIQRGWISNSSSSDANETLQSLANIFLNPSNLDYRKVSNYQELRLLGTKITTVSSISKQIQFTGVRFVGQLIGGYVLQSGKDGQPLVVTMVVDFDGNRIPIVYYGPVSNFNYDDTLLIEGVYITEANGVAAQRVQQLATSVSTRPSADTMILLRYSGIVLLWTLLCVSIFIWKLNLRRWRYTKTLLLSPIATLFCLLPLTVFLAGCSIDLSTTLSPDGTGITTILAQESRQNMDFLRSAPNISGYMSALIRDIKESGAMFEQYIEGDQELFFLQRYFNNSSGGTGNTFPIEGSWITVQLYTEGYEEVMRFLGVVDTRALYSDSTGISSDVANAIRDQLNQISMTYHLNVPGHIAYHNGDETTNQQVSWQLRMNESNYLVAETRFPAGNKMVSASNSLYIWIGLGVVFLIATLFLLASFLVGSTSNNKTVRKA
jgi:hypothetical protein